MSRQILIAVLSALVSSCASVPPQPDPICAEIAAFANSVSLDEPRSIRLETAWGRGLRGREDLLAEKQCDYAGYDPGRVLCEYLIRHSSTEFMLSNVARALRCHRGEPLLRFDRELVVEDLAGTVYMYGFRGAQENVEIIILFDTSPEGGDPFLEIAAERFANE